MVLEWIELGLERLLSNISFATQEQTEERTVRPLKWSESRSMHSFTANELYMLGSSSPAHALRWDGATVIQNVLSEETTEKLIKIIDESVAEAMKNPEGEFSKIDGFSQDHLEEHPDGSGLRLQRRLPLTKDVREAMREAMKTLAPTLQHELGPNAELWELAYIVANPGAPAQTFHRDAGEPDQPRPGLISVFIALQDVTCEMGPTAIIPRTHSDKAISYDGVLMECEEQYITARAKALAGRPEDEVDMDALHDAERASRKLRELNRCPLLKNGDALVYDSRLRHCGSANVSDVPRRILNFGFAADGASEVGFLDGHTATLCKELEGECSLDDDPSMWGRRTVATNTKQKWEYIADYLPPRAELPPPPFPVDEHGRVIPATPYDLESQQHALEYPYSQPPRITIPPPPPRGKDPISYRPPSPRQPDDGRTRQEYLQEWLQKVPTDSRVYMPIAQSPDNGSFTTAPAPAASSSYHASLGASSASSPPQSPTEPSSRAAPSPTLAPPNRFDDSARTFAPPPPSFAAMASSNPAGSAGFGSVQGQPSLLDEIDEPPERVQADAAAFERWLNEGTLPSRQPTPRFSVSSPRAGRPPPSPSASPPPPPSPPPSPPSEVVEVVEDTPTFYELPPEMLLEILYALAPWDTSAIWNITPLFRTIFEWSPIDGIIGAVQLSRTCHRFHDLFREPMKLAYPSCCAALGVAIDGDGKWLLDSRSAIVNGEDRQTPNVNVVGSEGFHPRANLTWQAMYVFEHPSVCRIAAYMLKTSPPFWQMDLSENDGMHDEGLIALIPAIARQLNDSNEWGNDPLAVGGKICYNVRLRSLKLHRCGIGDDGACALAELFRSLPSGRMNREFKLTLHDNPRIGARGKAALQDALRGTGMIANPWETPGGGAAWSGGGSRSHGVQTALGS